MSTAFRFKLDLLCISLLLRRPGADEGFLRAISFQPILQFILGGAQLGFALHRQRQQIVKCTVAWAEWQAAGLPVLDGVAPNAERNGKAGLPVVAGEDSATDIHEDIGRRLV